MNIEKKHILVFVVVLVVLGFLLKGQVIGYKLRCSKVPNISSLKVVGDTLSVHWKDTSTFEGNLRYDVFLYEMNEEGVYDFNDPFRQDSTEKPRIAFTAKDKGNYLVKVRAKNDPKCSEGYTEYASKEIVKDIW